MGSTLLYTIIPLRTSASETLTEQTIGRGLRLPYGGKRTGHDKVDKLTIIAHDHFKRIIEEANKPGSIIKQKNIIEIDPANFEGQKEVVVATTTLQEKLAQEKRDIEARPESAEKTKAAITIAIKQAIHEAIPTVNHQVGNVTEISQQTMKAQVIEQATTQLMATKQFEIIEADIIREAEGVYQLMVDEFIQHTIEIPRIVMQASQAVASGFHDFDLDVTKLNYHAVSEDIMIQYLNRTDNQPALLTAKYGSHALEPDSLILHELINFPKVDYDSQADLVHKLIAQALLKLKADCKDDNQLEAIVKYHKREVAAFIYAQMNEHYYCTIESYEKPIIKPFTQIEGHNLLKIKQDSIHRLTDTITPTSSIPQKVFSGFNKACHTLYRFDSRAEKDFASILEQDADVIKWLRPHVKQCNIYWDHHSKRYEPDFVIETANMLYLTEIKADNQMNDLEVKAKAKAAGEYCQQATEHNALHGGKPWKYLLIPQHKIQLNSSFSHITEVCE